MTCGRACGLMVKKDENVIVLHMALRTCEVTCLDALGIEHTVHITTQTRCEAVAYALHTFREHNGATRICAAAPPVSWSRSRRRKLSMGCAYGILQAGSKRSKKISCGNDAEESAAGNCFRVSIAVVFVADAGLEKFIGGEDGVGEFATGRRGSRPASAA